MRRWLRYAAAASLLCAGAVGIGWLWPDEAGGKGVRIGAGVAWALQLVSFGALLLKPPGTPGFLAAWVGGILVRFAAVGIVAFVVAGQEGVSVLATLLTLVGLLLVLLLLEPIALRPGPGNRTSNG